MAPSWHQVGTKLGLSPAELSPQLESRLESALAARIFIALWSKPLGKAEIAPLLGHKTVSGELHKQVKRLVDMQLIEPTIPEKPTSRLQKYRLSEKWLKLLQDIAVEDS